MNLNQIIKPTLLLDEKKARHHIAHMTAKARNAQVRFRPHFKTHQSAAIGQWFRYEGITAITVSSVEMALYFADHGWQDITIAFPLNIRQLPQIASLAQRVSLHLLLDNTTAAIALSSQLQTDVSIWLEIDAGYGRTGLPWNALDNITAVSQTVQQLPHLHLTGLLTHAGDTYKARGKTAVLAIHNQTMQRLRHVQSHLQKRGITTEISIGDTPTCSLVDTLTGIDEIRPGNFIFYDLMQVQIGACQVDDISVAVACPVVAIYPERHCIAIYGGAVHLSKEVLIGENGRMEYGRIALPTETSWEILHDDSYVYSLSQEHGLIHASDALLQQVKIGDLLCILPVHSCLTANLLKAYQILTDSH
ncbi:MAG: alanine racemase [Anaerolineales bacterium]|nr:alanine racemase [Anaerolineales bacterium]